MQVVLVEGVSIGVGLFFITMGQMGITRSSSTTTNEEKEQGPLTRQRTNLQVGQAPLSLGPGSLFGEMSLLDDCPATATVFAREASEAFRMTRDAFRAICHDFPDFEKKIIQVAESRGKHVDKHAEEEEEGEGGSSAGLAGLPKLKRMTSSVAATNAAARLFNSGASGSRVRPEDPMAS